MKSKPLYQLVLLAGGLATTFVQASDRQQLAGHVPRAARQLASIGRLDATNELRLAISLPLRNPNELKQLIEDIYNPASPNFRHYLGAEEFAGRFGPSPSDYAAVAAFCRTNGLAVIGTHPNRTILDVTGPVGAIESAFHTTLHRYPHPTEKRSFYAPATEPAADLAVSILHVQGLDNLHRPRPLSKRVSAEAGALAHPSNGSGASGSYMGNDFRSAYAPGVTLTGSGQVMGLVEFDGYYLNDVTSYERLAGLPSVTLQNVLVGGFSGQPGPGNGEVSLDIQLAVAMAPGLQKIMVYETSTNSVAYDLLNRIATDNTAKEIGCTWTWGTYDPGTDQIFQQYAAQGQSFFQAAGDGGAYLSVVDAPADNPYITIVGGTTLTTTSQGAWAGETAWNDGLGDATAGGISTIYPLPSWQNGINMNANFGSTAFRNLPDVAMIADNILNISDNGQTNDVVGTSVGAPLWAAFAALANQQAVINGQPLVGFVNPALYAIAKGRNYFRAFHDITSGDNGISSSQNGFPAVANYDLCTGWGTPTGSGTINLLLQAANNQIDHFAWAPIDASGATNGVVAVTLTAQTAYNTTASSFAGTASLSAAQIQTNVLFSDGFEGGLLNNWMNLGGPYTVGIDSTTGAAGTSRSLSLLGGDTNGTYNGVSASFPNLSPDYVEFYVKIRDSTATGAYVVAGQAAYRTNSVFHFHMDASLGMGLFDGAQHFYGTPYVSGQWYKIGLRLYWSTRTLDYYANDALVMPNIPFCNTNLTSLAVMNLYNIDPTLAWWDQISLVKSASVPIGVLPSTTPSFAGGTWSGSVTLAQVVTNVVLTAADNAGHDGTTSPFSPGVATPSGPPQISSQPFDQTAIAGATVRFSVGASGGALNYQWSKNGSSLVDNGHIVGAGSGNLTISNVLSADQGSYAVAISNSAGNTNSARAILTVIDPAIIRQPLDATIGIGQTNRFQVLTAGTPPLTYQWYSVINGHTKKLTGKRAASLTLGPATKAMSGGYFVVVANALAPPNVVTSVVAHLSVLLLETPLTVQVNGHGSVSPDYNGRVLHVGKKYTITAKPDTGYVFAGWSGSITSAAPKLTFLMQSNLVLTASFTPSPFLPVAGTYQGLFYDTNGIAQESSGFLSAVVSARGSFSARLQWAGGSWIIFGQFVASGAYSHSISLRNGGRLSVALQLDLASGDQLTGQVSDGVWTAQLSAKRTPFRAGSNRAPQAGKYTLVLPGGGNPSTTPGGDGYAAVTVLPSGSVRMTGRLADGTRISETAFLSGHGDWPLYLRLYAGQGSALGWLSFDTQPTNDISGSFAWFKPPGDRINPAGFAFANGVLGSRYSSGMRVPVLNLSTGMVWFANGNLPQSYTNTFLLGTGNKVTHLGTGKLSLSFIPSSGSFLGRAVNPETDQSIPFSGVVLQKQNLGAGFFLGTDQSGRVFLGPAP